MLLNQNPQGMEPGTFKRFLQVTYSQDFEGHHDGQHSQSMKQWPTCTVHLGMDVHNPQARDPLLYLLNQNFWGGAGVCIPSKLPV